MAIKENLDPGKEYVGASGAPGINITGGDILFENAGEVNFTFGEPEANRSPQANVRIRGTSEKPTTLHVGGSADGEILNITGNNPQLELRKSFTIDGKSSDAFLVINAGANDADKAVVNVRDNLFDGRQQDFNIIMDSGSAIDIIKGRMNFIQIEKDPEGDINSSLRIYGGKLTVHPDGILDSSDVVSLIIGSGLLSEKTKTTEVESRGGMIADGLVVWAGASLKEQADVLIDGIGKTATTRSYMGLAEGGQYYGNIEIDDPTEFEPGFSSFYIRSGKAHGNVLIREGRIVMHNGAIDGDFTVEGGKVVIRDEETGVPPYFDFAKGLAMVGGDLDALDALLLSGGNLSILNGANADIGTLENFNEKLLIGSDKDTKGGASLAATNVDLGEQGKILMDPPWGLEPANAAIENLGPVDGGQSVLKGQIGVGMNSLLAIGTRDLTWLPEAVKKATDGVGLDESGVKSAFGLFRPLQIASGGKLMVDGGKTSEEIESALGKAQANTATFASKSLLALNGLDSDIRAGKPAITFAESDGSVAVHDGARLFISEAQPGVLYKVVDTDKNPIKYYSEDGATRVKANESTAWEGENLRASSGMIKLTAKGDGVIEAGSNEAGTVYPDLSPGAGGAVDEIYKPKPNNPAVNPEKPTTQPEKPTVKPEKPTAKPEKPAVKPEKPAVKPEKPVVKPETPEKPEAPETPAVKPEAPGVNPGQTPVAPEAPAPPEPVVPDSPVTPADPEIPVKPGPEEPETPVVNPGQPPVAPEAPGQPEPVAPDSPETPAEPEIPEQPVPETPEQPAEEPETSERDRQPARTILADPNSPYGGVRFLSRATNNEWNGGISAKESASVIESASRMAVIGAVPQMALAANEAAAKAVNSRLGVGQSGLLSENYGNGFGLWIMPLYQSANGFGMEADNLNYDFSGALGGVALGADWSFSENLRAGLAFNIGGGYAKGSGEMRDTENRMSFWGLGAYSGWRPGDFGLLMDFGLTSTYNKLKQDLPRFMGMDDLKSDVEALVLSAGIRAEYTFHAGALDITPHAGARYHYARAASHDIKSGGSTIIEADSFEQHFWTFPVGVAVSADISLSGGWSLKPAIDFAATPAAGDINAKTKARFTGTSHKVDVSTQIMDRVTYGGVAGFELAKDNLSLSVFYSGQFGPHSSSHGVNAAFRYEF